MSAATAEMTLSSRLSQEDAFGESLSIENQKAIAFWNTLKSLSEPGAGQWIFRLELRPPRLRGCWSRLKRGV